MLKQNKVWNSIFSNVINIFIFVINCSAHALLRGFPCPALCLLVREMSDPGVRKHADTATLINKQTKQFPRHSYTLQPAPHHSYTLASNTVNTKLENVFYSLWIHLCFPWQKVTASEIPEVWYYFMFHCSYITHCNINIFKLTFYFNQLLFTK